MFDDDDDDGGRGLWCCTDCAEVFEEDEAGVGRNDDGEKCRVCPECDSPDIGPMGS